MKAGNVALKALELSGMDFEVRMKTDEIRKRIHPGNLHLTAQGVETIVVT